MFSAAVLLSNFLSSFLGFSRNPSFLHFWSICFLLESWACDSDMVHGGPHSWDTVVSARMVL